MKHPLASSPSLENVETILKTHSLGDFLPYVSYEKESRLFYGHQRSGFVLETLPLVGAGEGCGAAVAGFVSAYAPHRFQPSVFAHRQSPTSLRKVSVW